MDLITTDADTPAVRRREAAGSVLAGRWRLIEVLGAGGGGEVWRARDLTLDEDVAVKRLPLAPAAADGLRGEVALARRVVHPGVARVHELVALDDGWLVSMALVPGRNLRTALADGAPLARRWSWWRQVVAAMAAAHACEVVHRDLKPENVIVDGDRAVVVDFGLAAAPTEAARGGTAGYAAPEVTGGAGADPRGDVFALAVLAVELVTGARPAAGDDVAAAGFAEVARGAAPALAAVLRAALEPEPARRPGSAVELAAAIERAFAGAARRRRRRRIALAAVAALALAALALVVASRPDPARPPPAPPDRHARAEARFDDYRRLVRAQPSGQLGFDQLAAAQTILDDTVTIDADHVSALVTRAGVAVMRAYAEGNWDLLSQARADLDRAAVVAPVDAEVREVRCTVERTAMGAPGAGDAALEATMAACEAALLVSPRSALVFETLGLTLADRCDEERALAMFERAIELAAGATRRAQATAVTIALRSGRLGVADTMSARMVATIPDADAHLHRGAALLALGRLDEAGAAFERSLGFATTANLMPLQEAAAIRGLRVLDARGARAMPAAFGRRLDELEAGFREEPAAAPAVARALALVDPAAALTWRPPDGSCDTAIERAHLQLLAGDRDGARADLASCVPAAAWERACLDVARRRVGGQPGDRTGGRGGG